VVVNVADTHMTGNGQDVSLGNLVAVCHVCTIDEVFWSVEKVSENESLKGSRRESES
jgi:hypothetical protein